MLNLVHYSLAQQRINFPLLLWVYCNVPINIKKKVYGQIFMVPTCPTEPHYPPLLFHSSLHSFGQLTSLLLFLSFSSFSFAVEHISSLSCQHLHITISTIIFPIRLPKNCREPINTFTSFFEEKISHLFGGFFTFTWGYFYLSFNNDIHVIYEHWKWYLCVFMYGFCIGGIIW